MRCVVPRRAVNKLNNDRRYGSGGAGTGSQPPPVETQRPSPCTQAGQYAEAQTEKHITGSIARVVVPSVVHQR